MRILLTILALIAIFLSLRPSHADTQLRVQTESAKIELQVVAVLSKAFSDFFKYQNADPDCFEVGYGYSQDSIYVSIYPKILKTEQIEGSVTVTAGNPNPCGVGFTYQFTREGDLISKTGLR